MAVRTPLAPPPTIAMSATTLPPSILKRVATRPTGGQRRGTLLDTMRSRALPAATVLMWSLALLIAVAAARYFLPSPPMLRLALPPDVTAKPVGQAEAGLAEHLYLHHRALFLTHIACAIAALLGGPLQFVGSLRAARPRLHRAIGFTYLSGVLVAGVTALPLAFLMLGGVPGEIRPAFYPSVAAFVDRKSVV